MEMLIAELMIADMPVKLDPSQYGNQKGISIQSPKNPGSTVALLP